VPGVAVFVCISFLCCVAANGNLLKLLASFELKAFHQRNDRHSHDKPTSAHLPVCSITYNNFSPTALYSYLYIDCRVVRNPDGGNMSDRDMLLNNNNNNNNN